MKKSAFNLEAARKGAKVVTREGLPVKFMTVTADNKVLAVIKNGPTFTQVPEKFNLDGSKYKGTEHYTDLFMAAS